ncbi:MAG: proton-conducting transporter membrane subunit, partial [candidate division WOR-3 bacterium]
KEIILNYSQEILLTTFLIINIFYMISFNKKGYHVFLIFSYFSLILTNFILKSEGFLYLFDIGTFLILYPFYLTQNKEEFSISNFFIYAHLLSLHLILKTESLIIFFISLELLSFVFYILIGLESKKFKDLSPLIRYFVIGSLSSLFLLFSLILLYTKTQTLSYKAFTLFEKNDKLYLLSFQLFIFSLGFKILFIPFQFFMPDVFEKISIPYLTLISLTPKAGILIFLYKIKFYLPEITFPLSFFAIITILLSNLAGIYENRIKRVLAYSSISHSAFLLFSILLPDPASKNVLLYYLIIYFIMKGGILISLTYFIQGKEDIEFEKFKGLFFTDKIISISIFLFIISLSSFPPSGGFFAKFYLLYELFKTGYKKEVLILILLTILSFGYYIKFLNYFFLEPGKLREKNYSKFFEFFTLSLSVISLFGFIFIKFFI